MKLQICQAGKCTVLNQSRATGGSWSLECLQRRACPCTLLHQGDGCCPSHWLTTHPGSCCPHCRLCLDPLATNFWCLTSLCSVFVDLLPQHLLPTAFCFPSVVSNVGNKPYFCHPWLASYKYLLCSQAFKPVWRQGSGQLWKYLGTIPLLMRRAYKPPKTRGEMPFLWAIHAALLSATCCVLPPNQRGKYPPWQLLLTQCNLCLCSLVQAWRPCCHGHKQWKEKEMLKSYYIYYIHEIQKQITKIISFFFESTGPWKKKYICKVDW